jgi:hypothetical protein
MSTRRERQYGSTADEFPARLATWLVVNRELVDALVALRRLGNEASAALAAALDIRRVATMRLSLGLWSAFVADEGDDAERVLTARLSLRVVDQLHEAIGDPSSDVDARRLRVIEPSQDGSPCLPAQRL